MADFAEVYVLSEGYVGERVGSSVTLVIDGDQRIVIDPGMVASQSVIIDALGEYQLSPTQITDVILSHHHPDHTMNVGLFPNARVHDYWAIYHNDLWEDRESMEISRHVALLATPGHSQEDISTLIQTEEGVVATTHLWWTVDGPAEDPFAPDQEKLQSSREALLQHAPIRIIPGHGPSFAPSDLHLETHFP